MIDCEIISVLVGKVAPLGERAVPSAIGKRPVEGAVAFDRMGLILDEQGDRSSHGGVEKAIHHYPFDHYQPWADQLQVEEGGYHGPDLSKPGAFGENISTLGIVEKDVCLGDIFELGTGKVQIVQGRQPCWKLNERFGQKTMARLVQKSGMTGWYYKVLEPGEVASGDRFRLIERLAPAWPLSRVIELLYEKTTDFSALEDLVALPFLAKSWAGLVARRLERGEVEDWTARLEGRS